MDRVYRLNLENGVVLYQVCSIWIGFNVRCGFVIDASVFVSLLICVQLDAAAPILAKLKQPIIIAKLNADKYSRLARKLEIEYVYTTYGLLL